MSISPRIKTDFSSLVQHKVHPCLEAAIIFWEKNPGVIYCISDDNFYQYKDGLYSVMGINEVVNLLTRTEEIDGIKRLSRAKKVEIIQNMKDEQHYRMDDFNQDNLINFQNCYLNLVTMETVPHSPEYISTIQLPYKYNKNADCPLWIKTLKQIFADDESKIDILQEFVGYCLTRDTKQEKALFMLGDGQNGKSTVIEGITYMLGEGNVSSLSLRYITDSRYVGTIINKYANVVSEIPKNVADFEDEFKIITSGEPVTINNKYDRIYKARPYCKLIFAANKMPRIGDTSNAVYRRLIVLLFNQQFKEKDQDKSLKYKLTKEASGIFNWAVEGLQRLLKRGYFELGNSVKDAVREIEENNNTVLQFFNEHIQAIPNGEHEETLTKQEVFEAYKKYCIEIDSRSKFTRNNFSHEFYKIIKEFSLQDHKKNIIVNGRRSTVRVWTNIKWKTVDEEANDKEIQWEE